MAPWIGRALSSIESQTYPSYEVICVDDSSSDNTVDQIGRLAPNAKLVQGKWKNAACARNAAARIAKGDFLAFLDADDYWFDNHLAIAVQAIAATETELTVSDYERVEDEKPLVALHSPLPLESKDMLGTEQGYEFALSHPGGLPTASMVISRKAFRRVGGFDEQQIRRHDIDLFLRLVDSTPWTYTRVLTWQYWAQRPGSISSAHAECAYFVLRLLINAKKRSPDLISSNRIKNQAKVASAYALIDSDHSFRKRSLEMAWPYLPIVWRFFYSFSRFSPTLCKHILQRRRSIKQVELGDSRLEK